MNAFLSFNNTEGENTLVEIFTRRDRNGKPCLMIAIARQSMSCIGPLLEKLENLDFDSYNIDKMKALESDEKKNILHVAAEMLTNAEAVNTIDTYSSYSIMEELADRPDNNGTTPLIVACKHQNHLMARRLIGYGAKIDHIDNDNNSPIYLATSTGSAETLHFFLVHGKFLKLYLAHAL